MTAHSSLSDQVYEVQAFSPGTLAAGAQAGTLVDTLGWDGCVFVINPGAIAGGATLDAYVKRDSASAFTTSTNVANAALVQVTSSAANSNAIQRIDVYRPAQRYLKLILTSGGAAVAASAVAVLYKRAALALPPTRATGSQLVKADVGG